MGNEITVTALRYYPIKSCAGTSTQAHSTDDRGFLHDRRFMLIDEDSEFLTQRELPKMALIQPRVADGRMSVTAPSMDELSVPLDPRGGRSKARIWNDVVDVRGTTSEAAAWFSEFLGLRCRLVHLPDDSIRSVDPHFADPDDRVSLADGFPFLVTTEPSLEDLNARLAEPLPMDRFRPNIVVSGGEAWSEDYWNRIRIGEMEFRAAKPCGRCTITTVDQRTAEKGKEPLTTLAKFRNSQYGVLFGQNLIHEEPGTLEVGDALEVL